MYSKVLLASVLASVTSAVYINITAADQYVATVVQGTPITKTDVINQQSTAVVTVTSCSGQKCTEVPVTTGVTIVTVTSSGVSTQYTTYCPLSSSSSSSSSSSQIISSVPEVATTFSNSSSSSISSSVPSIEHQSSGGGNKVTVAGAAVLAGIAGAFLL